MRHTAKVAWRALALLQTELEDESDAAEPLSPASGNVRTEIVYASGNQDWPSYDAPGREVTERTADRRRSIRLVGGPMGGKSIPSGGLVNERFPLVSEGGFYEREGTYAFWRLDRKVLDCD
jgi:hypothetical protein